MKKSDDGKITFYPDTHEYFDSRGNKFLSVTTALKRFFPFADQEIAERVSQTPSSIYFGQKIETILATWEATAPCGTGLHGACERWIKTGEIAKGEHENGAMNFAKFMKSLCPRQDLRSELVVYDIESRLAGTLDLFQDAGDLFYLWDIKTSRKIDDMKLLQYSMQLELYRRLAQQNYGKPVCIRGILWFEGYFKNKEARLKILDTVPCDQEVDALLERRKKELAA